MNSNKLADALGKFETQLMESYRSGWNSYWKLVTDLARNPASLPAVQKEYLNYVSQTAPSEFFKVVEAGAQCYVALVESGSQIADQLYKRAADEVDAATRTNVAVQNESRAAASPAEFTFQGFVDDTPGRQFLVSNRSPQAVQITFAVSEFSSAAGSALVQVDLAPASFSLAPQEEKVVECRVTIPSALTPGIDYRALLSATGLPSLSIQLCVRSLGAHVEPEITVDDEPGS